MYVCIYSRFFQEETIRGDIWVREPTIAEIAMYSIIYKLFKDSYHCLEFESAAYVAFVYVQ